MYAALSAPIAAALVLARPWLGLVKGREALFSLISIASRIEVMVNEEGRTVC
jgi:hypothetical protein